MNNNIVLLIFFIFIFIFTKLSLRYVTDIAEEKKLNEPLPDYFHNFLPESMRNWHEYSDWIPIIPLFLFLYIDKLKHLNEFLFLICIIFLIRFISYSITVLPSPSKSCKCEWEVEPETNLRKLLNIMYQEGCNDCIFSGHTSIMVMSSLFLINYILPFSLNWIIIIYNIIGSIIIIGTRLHYSVDVFIAFVINILLFFSFRPYLDCGINS
jgi:hypothetical protein